jgi:hypothetical protein
MIGSIDFSQTVLSWLVFSIVLGLVAKANGRPFFLWCIVGLLIGPILSFLTYFLVATIAKGKKETEVTPFEPSLDIAYRSEPQIIDYLKRLKLSARGKRVFVYPKILEKKLNNAINSRVFPTRLSAEMALLLVDDSDFLGGRAGILITDKTISFKSLFASSNDFDYTLSFAQFHVEKKKVSIMGEVAKRFVNSHPGDIANIFSLINDFFKDRHAWHEKMASDGDVGSQFYLSSSSFAKPDVAEYWLTKAAENGHIGAQHNLGMHYMGEDDEKAFHWFLLAANQGSEISKQLLNSDRFQNFRRHDENTRRL